jgi:hypothetical protein
MEDGIPPLGTAPMVGILAIAAGLALLGRRTFGQRLGGSGVSGRRALGRRFGRGRVS